jgi:chorismate mutase / prephenate dehydratase
MMSRPARIDTPPVPAATTEDPPPPQDGWPGGLATLRGDLDRIDDQLHDLLMQRAQVVERVARSGKRGTYRPGREASIIRRLLRRHSGGLPAQALVRIWRELLAGTTAMQGAFSVAVWETDESAGFTQAAREHFGALTPLRVHRSPGQVMAEVSRGAAAVGVLPYPTEADTPRDAWWTALLRRDHPRLHVVARLPFWTPRAAGAPIVQSLVVSAIAPDASERDRSLLGLDLDRDVSRARLTQVLIDAHLSPSCLILRRDQGMHALAEVDGHLTDDDPRLAVIGAALSHPVVLGAYAIPEDGGAA